MATDSALDTDAPPDSLRRWTLTDYHRLTRSGVLTEDDRIELLEGWIVEKMAHNPPHDGTLYLLQSLLLRRLPDDWLVRVQSSVTLPGRRGSEPEPDIAIVRGPAEDYLRRHPGPADIALVVEVSDTTLAQDRGLKARVYARAAIPVYWIVNIPDRRVELYAEPRGGRSPAYRTRTDFVPGDSVPLTLGDAVVGHVPVGRLFPTARRD